ncbi:MAG: cyclic lactone autoinducer peptide [Clostridia bacterium]|nr:cyclic lactone autoinducer peptide [Clostridia bacterium]
MFKFLDKILAVLANYSAKAAVGTASFWNSHQPKEPKNLSK